MPGDVQVHLVPSEQLIIAEDAEPLDLDPLATVLARQVGLDELVQVLPAQRVLIEGEVLVGAEAVHPEQLLCPRLAGPLAYTAPPAAGRNICATLVASEVSDMSNVFWDDLTRDLEDPDFLRAYITESVRIATADAIINALDEARVSAGLSKAQLARAIGAEPATVRRLFSSGSANPTLGTLAEVAAALGLRISIEPMRTTEREAVTEPLRAGRPSRATAKQVTKMRQAKGKPVAA